MLPRMMILAALLAAAPVASIESSNALAVGQHATAHARLTVSCDGDAVLLLWPAPLATGRHASVFGEIGSGTWEVANWSTMGPDTAVMPSGSTLRPAIWSADWLELTASDAAPLQAARFDLTKIREACEKGAR